MYRTSQDPAQLDAPGTTPTRADALPVDPAHADIERWLRRLRLVGLVLPVAFLAALPLLWPSDWHVIGGLVGMVAVVAFSRMMFSAIQRGYLQMVATQQRAVDAERQTAVLEERERIAREMHDSLAQVLSVAHLKLRTIEASPELSDGTRREVSELAVLCQESCSDVRESILGLRETGRGGRDFVGGIRHFLRVWSRTSGISATLTLQPDDAPPPLTPAQEVQLSRVLQEALANVRKHSGASHAEVLLLTSGASTRAEVRDDGVGFDADAPARADSYGLHTMRERVEQLGGSLTIDSTPGVGTSVVAQLPVKSATAEPVETRLERR